MPNFAPIVPATLPEDQRITAGHFYIDKLHTGTDPVSNSWTRFNVC